MNEVTPTFSTGTLRAWTRLPKYVRLLCALVAAIAVVALATSAIRAPSIAPAVSDAVAAPAPMRDPSVPDASRALSTDDRQPEISTPTF